jgi:hypothetical protein
MKKRTDTIVSIYLTVLVVGSLAWIVSGGL